jgi:hypothetical protein
MEKQGGMVFGFRKTATAVIKPERQIDQLSVSRYWRKLEEKWTSRVVAWIFQESL